MPTVEKELRFPFINLEKAVARAKQLYDADQRGAEMSTSGAFAVWDYSEKSSGGFQTVAALKAYGLISSDGGRIKLTDHALRFFRDEREDERAALLKAFGTNPTLLMNLFNHWGGGAPADTLARSYLKVDLGMNEQSARAVLGIYKDNLAFADIKGSYKVPEKPKGPQDEREPVYVVKIGDYVQWTSQGADRLKPPRRVVRVTNDGFAFVHGSPGGLPVSELTVVDAPKPPSGLVVDSGVKTDIEHTKADINVYQTGDRLQITADVDIDSLQTLKDMLNRYEGILELITGRKAKNSA